MRNDDRGYVTRSTDGLHFEPIRRGSSTTARTWATTTRSSTGSRTATGLFLVYTRRGANNDHVFRHRAPLFMARVDPRRLRVIRETERILVPERGARLGNFGVTDVSASETWVTVAEWMQTWGPNDVMPVDNPYGSDGSVWIARIQWDRENTLFSA